MNREWNSWWLDVKLGARMLLKYPGLALTGVFGIAVAVAIAAGTFSVVYGNFLDAKLPFEEGERLVSLEVWDSAGSKPERRLQREYSVWREELRSVQEVSAFRSLTPNLIVPGMQVESVRVAEISAAGLRAARVRPLLGRSLEEADEREGAAPVVVIGESVWRSRFGADPAIPGKRVQLGSTVYEIAGVMPAGFAFPVNHRFWTPLRAVTGRPEPLTGPEVFVFGRLAPGATMASAEAELAAMSQRAAQESPAIYGRLRAHAMPYTYPFLGLHDAKEASALGAMNLIITLLLVLVSLNITILVYTRTVTRHAEISIRTALGAKRGRIVGQLFAEALVLSAAGAAAGVALAWLALRQVEAATQSIAAELPFWLTFDLSPGAVIYAGGLSVLAAAIVGVLPALQVTRREVQTGLRAIGAGGSGLRLGGTWTALVVAQVAFAVALLPGAVFAVWENLSAEMVDQGIAAKEFLTAQISTDAARRVELLRRLKAEPGVVRATYATAIPGNEPGASIEFDGGGEKMAPGPNGYEVRVNRVDPELFHAMDVPMLTGRGFAAGDVAGAAIVNQPLAERVFGGNALGKRFRYAGRNRDRAREPWYEIVGVVKDFPVGVSPGMNDARFKIYHPARIEDVETAQIALRIRGGDPSTFARRLPELGLAVDADLQVRNVMSLDEALRKEQWIRRLEAAVLGLVSLSVLLLSAAGIYALMSFTVAQRTKEIGIRMALGADRTRIMASIFSRALGQLAVGAVLGAAAGAALNRMSGDSLLRANVVPMLAGVALFMMLVGFLAAVGPARRCLGIQPTEALREQ